MIFTWINILFYCDLKNKNKNSTDWKKVYLIKLTVNKWSSVATVLNEKENYFNPHMLSVISF